MSTSKVVYKPKAHSTNAQTSNEFAVFVKTEEFNQWKADVKDAAARGEPAPEIDFTGAGFIQLKDPIYIVQNNQMGAASKQIVDTVFRTDESHSENDVKKEAIATILEKGKEQVVEEVGGAFGTTNASRGDRGATDGHGGR
ncbi:hypothetical protein FB45DRAFT_904747 [Roridomyces roridus]|uniref:Ribosome maturation protein SDO1/SBDS N-terminal domain-containing protein n=1 Tax=Roridomyces roridus TaxID=1738132 RepID=A0AAD7C5B1_9AGAR|nr:hypothetical protein FB45DRAFT_904747 [Roridomyces roridus]